MQEAGLGDQWRYAAVFVEASSTPQDDVGNCFSVCSGPPAIVACRAASRVPSHSKRCLRVDPGIEGLVFKVSRCPTQRRAEDAVLGGPE